MQTHLPIICDSGSGYIKIGYAGDLFPKHSIPAIIGRPMLRFNQQIGDVELKEIMIGDEAALYRAMLEISKPVEEGDVNNWDDMELLWDYSFKKLGANSIGNTFFMSEPYLNLDVKRKKMAEIIFEKFQFGKMQARASTLLQLYSEGLITGMVLESGDGVTSCIPVFEEYILHHCVKRMNITSRHITQYLMKLLIRRGYMLNSTVDFELVRDIKEKFCYISHDFNLDKKLADETTCLEKEYQLPDKTYIKLGRERFEAPELIFNPIINGHSFSGVSNLVFDTIQQCDIDFRKNMYENILICGGTTVYPGFSFRLKNDVIRLYQTNILKKKKYKDSKINIRVIDPEMGQDSTFCGGSILGQLMQNDQNFWVTKQDYEEFGKEGIIVKFNSNG